MTQDDLFDLSLEEDFDSFNPLADFNPDDDDDYDAPLESGVIRTDPREFPTMQELAQTTEEIAQQPASVRTQTLFDNMKPLRKVLMAVLCACQTPQENEELIAMVAHAMETQRSIFSPDLILTHLENAGAIERRTEEGVLFADLELEPTTVVIDGVEYLEPAEVPPLFWNNTETGQERVDQDKPLERMRGLFKAEPQYHHIYRMVLESACAEEGADQKNLNEATKKDPALQSPRLYVQCFIENLSEVDALKWEAEAWHITEIGREGLAFLDELAQTQA